MKRGLKKVFQCILSFVLSVVLIVLAMVFATILWCLLPIMIIPAIVFIYIIIDTHWKLYDDFSDENEDYDERL